MAEAPSEPTTESEPRLLERRLLPSATRLQWGAVEEYKPTTDSDSVSSSHFSEDGSATTDDNQDDGWGWFSNSEEDDNAELEPPPPPPPKLSKASNKPSSTRAVPRSALVRPVSQTQLSPLLAPTPKTGQSTGGGASLLLLGSEQWPTKSPRSPKTQAKPRQTLLSDLISEAQAKNLSLAASFCIILARGFSVGFFLRSIPLLVFRRRLITYDAVRTGLFVGLSLSSFHVMALSDSTHGPRNPYHSLSVAAVLTPLLALLPRDARTSIAWFMATRLIEAIIHGGLRTLPKSVLEHIPFSKWMFAIGNAQVIYTWVFHRDALPKALVDFIDSVSRLRSTEVAQSLASESPLALQSTVYQGSRLGIGFVKELLPAIFRAGRSLFGLVVSDVFSAASLLIPLFFKSPLAVAELCTVLGADVAFSGFAVVALSRILKRAAPSDAWAGGLFAGLVAVQLEHSETTRIELGLYMLTNALRALAHLATTRQVLPQVPGTVSSFFMYFSSLACLLATIENPDSRLVVGRGFREVLRRAVVA